MKKYLSLILIIMSCLSVLADNAAKIYTTADVPNVHLQDENQYISDPASFMSSGARDRANARLKELSDSTSAEVAVVILPSIGDADIFDFTQRLATKWGIGKADKDNGMLILFDMNTHQVRVHPGQGLEGIFTDVACKRLITDVIVPPMKTGDIDDAVYDVTDKIYTVLTDPEAAAEIRSAQTPKSSASPVNFWYFMLIPLIGTLWYYSYTCKKLWRLRGKSDYEKALELYEGESVVMDVVMCVITLGLVLPAVLIRRACAHHYRNKPRKCDVCGTKMNKLPEDEDNKYLTAAQDKEEQLGSVDYDVWLCPKCHASEIFPFPMLNTQYTMCPNCNTKAMHLLYRRVERPATTSRKGIGVMVYECKHCAYRVNRPYDIPIATSAAPIIIGGMAAGMGSRGGFGGGSNGGSFGGGSFGGGGSTGSW
ncbi:MAG: TPM domain-containing protein [Prevotella sp.]|nr:TPM domain-containing protein [Prevotella sp.]MCM1074596.1 TPM domain-containing protein [Ruminococcus sp.]